MKKLFKVDVIGEITNRVAFHMQRGEISILALQRGKPVIMRRRVLRDV